MRQSCDDFAKEEAIFSLSDDSVVVFRFIN
jgi:hypothetical protein